MSKASRGVAALTGSFGVRFARQMTALDDVPEGHLKILLAALAAFALAAPSPANAAIAAFNGGNYTQSGSVTNNAGLDLSTEAGAPAPGTAVWDSFLLVWRQCKQWGSAIV